MTRLDEDLRTLHIRCGSDIQHGLKAAGLEGDFLEFSDPFCIGPVPDVPREAFIRTRARFVGEAFGMSEDDALARLQREYAGLDDLAHYERVVLWFEHDAYDQLILAYVLKRLDELSPSARLEIVAVDSFPGIERFIGLGQLGPEQLAWLWPQRKPVTQAQRSLGGAAWAAITAPTPEALDALSAAGTPALPMLGRALRRHLRELPAVESGLGLSERLALEIVRDLGPVAVGRAFGQLTRIREPLPYLGDLMFWWLIQPLLGSERPALEIVGGAEVPWARRQLRLTAAGAQILRGAGNWLDQNPPDRWIGGVRVAAGADEAWCLDERADRVVRHRGARA